MTIINTITFRVAILCRLMSPSVRNRKNNKTSWFSDTIDFSHKAYVIIFGFTSISFNSHMFYNRKRYYGIKGVIGEFIIKKVYLKTVQFGVPKRTVSHINHINLMAEINSFKCKFA